MNLLNRRLLPILALGLSACGDNLVQFALMTDAGNNGGQDSGPRDGSPNDGSPTDGPMTDGPMADGPMADGPMADAMLDASVLAPTVISTFPINGAMNVPVGTNVTATFDRIMNGATLTMSTFTVMQGATPITGAVSYSGTTATFMPMNPLSLSLPYTARITTGAADLMGNALANDYVWSFNTGMCSQAPVELNTAGNFAVLAGASVTSTGMTVVTGDLGVSPLTSITGFPRGIVNGAQHAGTATSAIAQGHLTTAYDDAAGRSLCAVTVAGNLGGMTLTPGLYKSTSSLEISSGDLTLDAGGDADAVFIFQMASTLTTTTDRQVILAGSANAANVYWQVGTSATLGSDSMFKGTIMADQSITVGTGARLDGRALARIAAVTLAGNTIVKP
ncbi:MAG: DUF3494 domain-containing protein [Deltaproteobacteria bacterium]|nr:DUF3494 domain-containing protein [Deltaproteobacteria bacterium]